MKYTRLGRSSLVVSRLALGTIETQPNAADISLSEIATKALDTVAAPSRRHPQCLDDIMTDEIYTKALS